MGGLLIKEIPPFFYCALAGLTCIDNVLYRQLLSTAIYVQFLVSID
jgi:hypothetical protein